MHHGKTEIAEKILAAKSGAEAKRHSKDIKNDKNWCDISESVMYECLILKSKASPTFLKTLRNCSGKEIIHSTPYPGSDFLWSSGLDKANTLCSGGIFRGKNLLGSLLMRVLEHVKDVDDAALLHGMPYTNKNLSLDTISHLNVPQVRYEEAHVHRC